jgi:hypothetical protein
MPGVSAEAVWPAACGLLALMSEKQACWEAAVSLFQNKIK